MAPLPLFLWNPSGKVCTLCHRMEVFCALLRAFLSRSMASINFVNFGSSRALLQQTHNSKQAAQEHAKENAHTDALTPIHIQKSLETLRASGHMESQRVDRSPLGPNGKPTRKRLTGCGQEAFSNPLFPTKRGCRRLTVPQLTTANPPTSRYKVLKVPQVRIHVQRWTCRYHRPRRRLPY